MSTYLFIILSALFAIEASTSLARKAGYSTINPASGLILQSSLGLVSRALIFMFMPLIGSASDNGLLLDNILDIPINFLFVPILLLLLFNFRNKVETLFKILLIRVNENGSYFKKSKSSIELTSIGKNYNVIKGFKRFKLLYLVVLFAYVPYYLSWPIIMILLDKFIEHRGLILGLSSVLNGINTIILTVFVDPKLAQMGQYKRTISMVYDDLIAVRVVSAIVAFLLLLLITFCLL